MSTNDQLTADATSQARYILNAVGLADGSLLVVAEMADTIGKAMAKASKADLTAAVETLRRIKVAVRAQQGPAPRRVDQDSFLVPPAAKDGGYFPE